MYCIWTKIHFFHKKSRLCFIINLLIYLCFSDIDLLVIVHGFVINKFSNTYCIKKSNCGKSFAIYLWQYSFIIIITKCASSAFKSCINWRRRKTAPNCHKKEILDWIKCHLWINSSRFKFLSKEKLSKDAKFHWRFRENVNPYATSVDHF